MHTRHADGEHLGSLSESCVDAPLTNSISNNPLAAGLAGYSSAPQPLPQNPVGGDINPKQGLDAAVLDALFERPSAELVGLLHWVCCGCCSTLWCGRMPSLVTLLACFCCTSHHHTVHHIPPHKHFHHSRTLHSSRMTNTLTHSSHSLSHTKTSWLRRMPLTLRGMLPVWPTTRQSRAQQRWAGG